MGKSSKLSVPRSMAAFYFSLLWWAITEAYNVMDGVITVLSVGFFALAFYSKQLAHSIEAQWNGLSRWWSIVPVVVLLLWRLMRANYAHFESIVKKIDKLENSLEIEKKKQAAPEIFIKVQRPQETIKSPGMGADYNVICLENNSDRDAFNVQVQSICLDAEGRIRANFKTISRIGRHQIADVEAEVTGLKSGAVHDFENIYYYGSVDSKWVDFHNKNERIEYEVEVHYTDYQAETWYSAKSKIIAKSHSYLPRDSEWRGVNVIKRPGP